MQQKIYHTTIFIKKLLNMAAASGKNNKKSREFDLVLILKTEAVNLCDNPKITFSDLHNPPVANFGPIHRRNLCQSGFEKIRENLPRHRHFLEKF